MTKPSHPVSNAKPADTKFKDFVTSDDQVDTISPGDIDEEHTFRTEQDGFDNVQVDESALNKTDKGTRSPGRSPDNIESDSMIDEENPVPPKGN